MQRALFRLTVVATATCLVAAMTTTAGALTITLPLIGAYAEGTETSVQFGRLNYIVDDRNSDQTQADQWPFEVLQRGYPGQVENLVKAETTGRPMTFLFYADPMIIRPGDPAGWTTALPAPEVTKNHPNWLLRDSSGNVISRSDGDGDEMMDPGNVDYQDAAAANLIAVADDEGWDGVLLDEINEVWEWTMSQQPADYPTQTSWDAAQLDFVRNVCGQVVAAGKICLANTGDFAGDAGFWGSITGADSGSMQEFFVSMDTALGGHPAVATIENGWWQPTENRLITSQNDGKNSLFRAYADDADQVRYALGSYLLAWRGYGTFAASTNYNNSSDAWSSDFTTARDFGTPVATYRFAGELLWRQFQHGYVIVNPHDTTESAEINGTDYTLDPATAQLVATP